MAKNDFKYILTKDDDPGGDVSGNDPNAFLEPKTLADYQQIFDVKEEAGGYVLYHYRGKEDRLYIPGALEGVPILGIGEDAFKGCSTLKEVSISEGVISIGTNAFAGCTSLTSAVLPDTLTSIPTCAFSSCSALSSVTIGSGITLIDRFAFGGCSHLTTVRYTGDLDHWCKIKFVDYPLDNVAEFYIQGELVTDLVIPASITPISEDAFRGNKGLRSLVIADGVTRIGPHVFYDCSSLISLTIGRDVETVSDAFFGNHIAEIYNRSQIRIDPTEFHSIGEYALNIYTEEGGDKLVVRDGFAMIDGTLVKYFGEETSVTLPDEVTAIHAFAFRDRRDLTSIVLSKGVTSIGKYAFQRCTSLTSIHLPEGLTSVGYGAFAECKSLKKIDLSMGITSIAPHTFECCTSLTSVILPKAVTRIEEYAFVDCDIRTLHYNGTVAEWEQIKKHNTWICSTPLEEVVCTDGVIQNKRE